MSGIKKLFWKKNTQCDVPENDDIDIKDRRDREELANILEKMEQVREELHNEHREKNPEDFIEFGDFSRGNPNIWYWGDQNILKVGKFCSIAVDVTIMLGGEHHTEWISTYMFNKIFAGNDDIEGVKSKGNVTIGNDVWIGNGAKVMSGVTIGDGCVIGANALVTKDMPAYSICVGVPAKILKKRFSEETINKLEEIKWWNWSYEDINKVIPILQNNNIEMLIEYYNNMVLTSVEGEA
ncbi:MAG: hypothetical protein Ta2B_15100 [Termitinemataceae bacterium]|nr:MAG: hypothetical protein Ta2B_15100 [Termitinemataceae bacterium]